MQLLSQSELSAHHAAGETVIVKYRHAYEIQFSAGVGEFVMRPIPGQSGDLPYTARGRFHVVTPEHFRKLQTA